MHENIRIPPMIDLFMNKLAISKDKEFENVIKFLNTRPQSCLDGTIEKMIEILNQKTYDNSFLNSNNNQNNQEGGRRRTKYKKLNKTRKKKSKKPN
jgi:hypothetical protein